MAKNKKGDKWNNFYISILVFFVLGWIYFFVGGNVTGFSVLDLGDGYVLRNFDGLQDFYYDPGLLVIDGNGVRMKLNESNQSYPNKAYLQTIDVVVDGDVRWEYIEANHELNGQGLTFGYSTDQGKTWNQLKALNLSEINSSSGMMRLAAEFTSDGTNTPQIISLKLVYRIIGAVVQPVPVEIPVNTSNETLNISEEEQIVSPSPVVTEPVEMVPIPLELVPVKELPIISKKKIYYYLKKNEQLDLLYDLPKGTEVAFDFEDGKTILELVFKEKISSSFVIRRFVDSGLLPKGNLHSLDGELEEINVEDIVNDNLGGAILKSYYSDEDVEANNINESTLRMYTLEEEWIPLYSGVKINENFVWANPDHFSVFGVFGLVNGDDIGGVVISDKAIVVKEAEEDVEEEVPEEELSEFEEGVKEVSKLNDSPTGYSIVVREKEETSDYGVVAFLVGVFFLFSIFLYTFLSKKTN